MTKAIAQGDAQSQDEPGVRIKKSREAIQAWIEEQIGRWEPIERPERDTVQRLINKLQRWED